MVGIGRYIVLNIDIYLTRVFPRGIRYPAHIITGGFSLDLPPTVTVHGTSGFPLLIISFRLAKI